MSPFCHNTTKTRALKSEGEPRPGHWDPLNKGWIYFWSLSSLHCSRFHQLCGGHSTPHNLALLYRNSDLGEQSKQNYMQYLFIMLQGNNAPPAMYFSFFY